jgi:Phosphodiester glycosidase
MTLVAVAATGSAARRYRVRTDRIGRGVTMMKILDRRGPNRIRVLKIDPSGPATLDVALATEELPGHETTSSMARRHGALAAINGDFTLLPGSAGSGRPVNTFIEDGHLKASPLIWGRNFSITREETSARVGHTRLRSWVTLPSGERWTMTGTNPLEPANGFTMYTPAGGKLFAPPRRSCAARLLASGAFGWNGDMNGASRDFVVDKVVCRRRPLKRLGGNVVTAPLGSPQAAQIEDGLVDGYEVGYGWAFNRARTLDTIGGNPDLMDGGRVVGGDCEGSYFCDRNPRTGVGITPSGKILLVTVDGRSQRSRGMTLEEFGGLFRYLGAESAMNLDGGGSTTMVVRGRIVNVPSGGYERPVGSALLVLRGADGEEPEPGPYVTPSPIPTVSPLPTPGGRVARVIAPDGIQAAADPSCSYLTDPGSTGGMLDALAKGQLGHVDRLPPSLRAAVRVFRGSADCR